MSNPAPAVPQNNPQVGLDLRPAPMDFHHNPNPRDLQESQLDFVTSSWAHEVLEHNITRQQLQQYLAMYLKNERGLCGERTYCQYLGSVIEGLRTDVRKEKIKRLEAEKAHASLLRSNLEEYCCEYEDVGNLFPAFHDCEGGSIEDRAISAPAISSTEPLTQLACPSMATSMPDLVPVSEWCNEYNNQQQRPSSASRATTYMVPVEKDAWGQSRSCQKRQRSEEEEEGSSKRPKH